MVSVKNISVNYGDFQAVSNVSLNIKSGEIVALLGSNGAGKTTTINAISGVATLTKGTIEFEGNELNKIPAYKRVQSGIVQVPEGRKLFPDMTVMENLLIGSYVPNARIKRNEMLEKVLDLFPILAERKDQKAGSFSGGEQQMCAIARGLMACPKILMLDEPSLGLAPVIVDKIFDIIEKINKEGITILLVEQNVAVSLDIADTAYVIETGETVLEGKASELKKDDKLQKAYLGL